MKDKLSILPAQKISSKEYAFTQAGNQIPDTWCGYLLSYRNFISRIGFLKNQCRANPNSLELYFKINAQIYPTHGNQNYVPITILPASCFVNVFCVHSMFLKIHRTGIDFFGASCDGYEFTEDVDNSKYEITSQQ